jgi:hypothetical protein
VALPGGRAEVAVPLATREGPGGAIHVAGSCQLSLRALGIQEIRGPLGAFKLRDEIEIIFELTFYPAA